MAKLFILDTLSWPVRLPLKWTLFGLTLLVVLFPHPGLLLSHLRHWRDPNALIEPEAPAIQPLIDELRPQLNEQLSAKDTLKTIQDYVYKRIPYKWDWVTWGMADYLPTVDEVIEMGYEDCDGRAVVAASLLTHFGYHAEIVTDFTHVWVKTEHGETMGPGKKKAIIATDQGLEIQSGALAQLPRSLGYGIAVFPWRRELILICAGWLLMLRRNGGAFCSIVALVFLVAGWLFLRAGGEDHRNPVLWQYVVGIVNMLGAVGMLFWWARHNARVAAVDN